MKISNTTKILLLITTLLSYELVFAGTVVHTTTEVQNPGTSTNTDTSTQTGWQTQNANRESVEADTARTKAETSSVKADTAQQNANTASQNANTATQNANTASQNANTAAQNANIANMVTPVPAPKEVSVAPAGYVNCFTVKAGWFSGVWVPEHRVCQYKQSKEGIAWVEGYWACTKYRTVENVNGECTNWDWKPGHWVRTFGFY